jgi:hypothetical protein
MVESRLGVDAPKVEVRFERLTVEADVRVGRRAVPTLLNAAINAAQVTSPPAGLHSVVFLQLLRRRDVCCCFVFLGSLSFPYGFVAPPPSSLSGCMYCYIQACKLQGTFFFFLSFSFHFSKRLFWYIIISSVGERQEKRVVDLVRHFSQMDCPILIYTLLPSVFY